MQLKCWTIMKLGKIKDLHDVQINSMIAIAVLS